MSLYRGTVSNEDIFLHYLFFRYFQLIAHRCQNVESRGNQCQQIHPSSKTKYSYTNHGQDDQCNVECTHLIENMREMIMWKDGTPYLQCTDKDHDECNELERVQFGKAPGIVDHLLVDAIGTEVVFVETLLPARRFTLQDLSCTRTSGMFSVFYEAMHRSETRDRTESSITFGIGMNIRQCAVRCTLDVLVTRRRFDVEQWTKAFLSDSICTAVGSVEEVTWAW